MNVLSVARKFHRESFRDTYNCSAKFQPNLPNLSSVEFPPGIASYNNARICACFLPWPLPEGQSHGLGAIPLVDRLIDIY